jgi:hypothetical protein
MSSKNFVIRLNITIYDVQFKNSKILDYFNPNATFVVIEFSHARSKAINNRN